ncbi:MAG: hypothetical protein EOP56_08320 [Sphingobacteriales bacterium]|nr:MAG: hypothetical protein EOP56_08320 [Sphingobacteriales bacterium]
MFTPKRILILLLASIGLTILLYLIDSDPPTDDWSMRLINWAICFGIVLVFYLIYQLVMWLFGKLTQDDR